MMDYFVYICMFLFAYVASVFSDKLMCNSAILKNVTLDLIGIFPLAYFFVNRYDVGTDYTTYNKIFSDSIYYGFDVNQEPMTVLLSQIAYLIGEDFQIFLLFVFIITIYFMLIFLRRVSGKKSFHIVFFLYLILYFGPACNIMSQIMAVTFVTCAYVFLSNNNIFAFLFLVCIASLFHYSAVLIIPIGFLYFLFRKKQYILYYIFAILVIFIAIVPDICNYILSVMQLDMYYVYLQSFNGTVFFKLCMSKIPLYLIEFMFVKKLYNDSKIWIFLILFEIGFSVFSLNFMWIGRMIYYFSVSHLILISKILNSVTKTNNKRILKMFIVLYGILYFYIAHFYLMCDSINLIRLV